MNRAKILLFSVLSCLLLTQGAMASSSEWVQNESTRVRLVTGSLERTPDGRAELRAAVDFLLRDGWHTYWRTPGDAGVALSVDSSAAQNVENVKIQFPAPTRYVEVPPEGGTLETYGYIKTVAFPLTITLSDPAQETHLNFSASYIVCDKLCISHTEALSLTLPANAPVDAADSELVDAAFSRIPQPSGTDGMSITAARVNAHVLEVDAHADKGFASPDIFIEESSYCCRYPKPEVILSNGDHDATFRFTYEAFTEGDMPQMPLTFTLVDGAHAVEATLSSFSGAPAAMPESSVATATNPSDINHALVLFFALLGGLILNIMPCVLPVLSLKMLSMVKHGASTPAVVRRGFIASAAGIIFSFLVLAMGAVLLKGAGMAVGWGFQFQDPNFLIALTLIVTLFASNLWGHFEIGLPAWLGGTITGSTASGDDHSLAGHFITGAFATLLATPCSAPFLGTAVGFALSQGAGEILSTFLAMGVGMALPYLLVATFPSLVRFFPKPGHWMVSVKHFLGFLLAATALWLLWVLSHQIGEAAAILVSLLVAVILLKLWKFGNHPRWGRKHILIPAIALLAFAAFLIPVRVQQVGIVPPEQAESTRWQHFDETQIAGLVAGGKTVLVDVTADWCLTCKVNKLAVLDAADIQQFLSEKNVVLMKADLTSPDAAISDFLNRHGRYGIPFNIVFGPGAPEGIALSELLTKDAVREAVEKASRP